MAKQEKEAVLSQEGEVFVRDHLAEYRTDLAIRRTFLSYLRTALAFTGGGLAMVKFSGHPLVTLLGWLLIPAGVVILVQGVVTYRKMRRAVEMERQKTEEAELAKR